MQNLSKLIYKAAPQAFYVGGVLRDSLLKKYSGDIDLALPREQVKPAATALAKTLKASVFEMDSNFCVWRLTTKGGLQIDLSALVGKDIKEDLKRRDFTINALAYPTQKLPLIKTKKSKGKTEFLLTNLKKDFLLDLNNGVKDLKLKKIRHNAKAVFEEDPLRLLRALRVAAELKFSITPATLKIIKQNAALINQSAGERLQEELKRLFRADGARQNIELLDKAGLLFALLPEIEKQKHCAEVYYGKGGVFTHTMLVVERAEYLLNHLKEAFPKYHKKLAAFAPDKALFIMAALLHDIAKPATAKKIKGRLRFFHHEEKGAAMAEVFLKQLKYSTAEQKLIYKMIFYHLRPSNLASNEIITDKGVYKFFKELGDSAIPMLLLCWADYTSYVSPVQVRRLMRQTERPIMSIEEAKLKANIGKTLRHLQVLNFLFNKYFNETKKIILPRGLIDGRDIMATLKIPPSPKVGEILEQAIFAQIEGKIDSKTSALEWLLKNKAEFLK
ncbi:MAG: HD domain-containing protein [Elusimicrobiota bacterium]|jgi:putative nucleotidyltransferase with HDIG domain|nr:HD domain-containing protein [Elusimicrobiota bacterium]